MSNPRLDLYWRVVKHVDFADDGCWLWRGWTGKDGYGRTQYYSEAGRRHVLAHRLSYELFRGPIPEGLSLDHLCRVRACVNPEHLEPVTNRENLLRSTLTIVQVKTHCKRGHALEGDNLYWRWRRGVRGVSRVRQCKECGRVLYRQKAGIGGLVTKEEAQDAR